MSTPRRRWTVETIESELRPLIAELGRLPKRSECEARGLGGMYRAMRKQDAPDWGYLLEEQNTVLDALPAGARQPTVEEIATAAYFLHINGEDGDPVQHWLQAERQLATV
jgi:Protein of unknown function (DUF2934)